MRKVVAGAFLSLDGIMQAPGGPEEDPTQGFGLGGWTVNYWDDAMGAFMAGTMSAAFDLLLGRKTYEIFAAHWPFAGEDDPIRQKFDAATKYVATSSAEPLTWVNSVALRGNVAIEVADLKRQDGPDLLLQGSSELIQALLARDLIDEFNLLVFPLLLGRGKRLFGRGARPAGLRLIDSRASSTGVVMSRYVRAGEIVPGSFAFAQPGAAEIARQARMAREG
jgi:dihydrofolate reductase